MKKSYLKILLIMLVSTLVLVGCTTDSTPAVDVDDDLLILTSEELSEFDGQDGRPAYIAIDGIIYDVTDVRPWSGGEHNGFSSGKDLTEEIKTMSPHGVSKLDGLTIVGRLED